MSPDIKKFMASSAHNATKSIHDAIEDHLRELAKNRAFKEVVAPAQLLGNLQLLEDFQNKIEAAGNDVNNLLKEYGIDNLDIPFPFAETESKEPEILAQIEVSSPVEPEPEASITPKEKEVTYARFASWKDFFGDFDMNSNPNIETELRNTLIAVINKFPEHFEKYKQENRTDYLGAMHELYLFSVGAINYAFNSEDNRTKVSAQRVLSMVDRLNGEELIAAENYETVAQQIRQGQHEDGEYLVTILENLRKPSEEVLEVKDDIDITKADIKDGEKALLNLNTPDVKLVSEEDKDLIRQTINYIQARALAVNTNVVWPVASSVVEKVTNLPSGYVDWMNSQNYVVPTGEIRNGHPTYQELEVIKLVLYQKNEELQNIKINLLKRRFKELDRAYKVVTTKNVDVDKR